MRELFVQCFDQPLSPAQWNWKYGNRQGLASGAWLADGQLIAHYAGFPRRVVDAGQDRLAVQIGDVMVHPSERGRLMRHSPFYQVAAHFLEQNVGTRARFLHAFGFPNERALRLGEQLGLYAPVCPVIQLVWSRPDALPTLSRWQQCITLTSNDLYRADSLWSQMRRDFTDALLGVRDAERLRQRYVNHPDQPYQVHGIRHRLTRRFLGIVVTRLHAERLEWLDLVAPRSTWDECAWAVCALARLHQRPVVTLWMTEPFAALFTLPHRREALAVQVPCNIHTPGPAPDTVRGRWLLTGGDTDFL